MLGELIVIVVIALIVFGPMILKSRKKTDDGPIAEPRFMRINIVAAALTVGLVWGVLGMLVTGVGNLLVPGYGQGLLDVMASVYPGYAATPTLGQVIIGTLYGMLDGAIVGTVFAWLYNTLAARLRS